MARNRPGRSSRGNIRRLYTREQGKEKSVRKEIESFSDSRILPCPICGKEAFWRRITIGSGMNRTGNAPEGAEIIEERVSLSGRKIYRWERIGYAIHCKTPKCRCRTPLGGYRTLEEAIDFWNSKRM